MQHQQLADLLAQMTLDEKIGQLMQVSGDFFSDNAEERTGPMAQLGIADEELANVGTVLNIAGAEECRRIQTSAMRRHRLHIPTMFMSDVIHGYETIFPIPLAMGSSWNPAMARRMAEVAARESSVAGLSLTFSPMIDLVRDPRWGRVMESTGEDPYLNARMAEALVHGYQGDDLLHDTDRVAACVKHFAAYGAVVGGREYNTVDMSERLLRDMYLPGYRAAVAAGAKTVMTSFNTVDGMPATGNRRLFRDILRGEWGFDGVVISDFNAVRELIAHGVAEDEREAARLAIEASVDIEMMSVCYLRSLADLVAAGEIDISLIDDAAMRVLTLKNDLGLFEHPFRGMDEARERQLIGCDEHRAEARQVADCSIVLLKNEHDALPLGCGCDVGTGSGAVHAGAGSGSSSVAETASEAGSIGVEAHAADGASISAGTEPAVSPAITVALAGPLASSHDVLGAWSFKGRPQDAVSMAEGMESLSAEYGVNLLVARQECDYFEPSQAAIGEAVELARRAGKVVLALGETSAMAGEASSRTNIALPQAQIDLFNAVKAANAHVVVVVFNGRPLDLGAIGDAEAIVEAWFPGSEAGSAVADVLYGAINPSGRLSMSFPQNVGQVPVYYNADSTGRPYEGAPGEKYVSKYLDASNYARYPFGFGLSYSSFVYGAPLVSSATFDAEHPLDIAVTVTNDSDIAGIETVQCYVRDKVGQVVRPVKELKGFRQIELAAHETGTIHFALQESDVRYVHADLGERSDPGAFDIMIGPNSRDLSAPLRVTLV
ncbi:glycoside hydrolase family 3 N-terminal domain-containing protein [Bifidobacterium sp.]|jgi:beta-glucosidase|uniref:glycoside hydrolase family 3 N-terminal domain-containing protein n=1 Tax=Bifidobacterium sp. TaxID=41200 RepID=UPI0025BF6E03|nr:glycoside hydrolase family 3 N-terminal domain-containing protein [Bifidobacterium sp.]MCH4209900.1 glycoside hydrolase family 3 C-terminal domain-containing protein [Bifidobacterium sp.]MCI1225356.1 glycoside hydrolase family 3 C-terminal domain-containing protein [Bifidobacterium sp.]